LCRHHIGSIPAFHRSNDRTRILRPALASIALLVATAAHAQDAKFLQSLRKIEPTTRLEQICDLEAMNRIKRETGMKADRAKSDVISSPHHNNHTLTVNGGAFRADAKWFELSFVCMGSPDHLHVTAFKYKIGKPIPQSKWPSLGLWR
jgi:hypothetical protein